MLINNDLWLTQDLIAELFGTARSTITEHINNIINEVNAYKVICSVKFMVNNVTVKSIRTLMRRDCIV